MLFENGALTYDFYGKVEFCGNVPVQTEFGGLQILLEGLPITTRNTACSLIENFNSYSLVLVLTILILRSHLK